jgi:UDP-perosamine 4-acetyltransferase
MSMTLTTKQPLILLGAGGHAKVLLSLAQANGLIVLGVCDPDLPQQGTKQWRGIPVLGDEAVLDDINPDKVGLINGVGQLVGSSSRKRLFEKYRAKGFHFPVLIHPAAWVDSSAQLGEGVQIMAGAIVQPDCRIGENTIINTCASVDHDSVVEAHVHIAPRATLCGTVYVHAQTYIGSGSTIIQNITVGEQAVVGAGATLVRDLADRQTLIGSPARNITKQST